LVARKLAGHFFFSAANENGMRRAGAEIQGRGLCHAHVLFGRQVAFEKAKKD